MGIDMLKCDEEDIACEHCRQLEPYSVYFTENTTAEATWCISCAGAFNALDEKAVYLLLLESSNRQAVYYEMLMNKAKNKVSELSIHVSMAHKYELNQKINAFALANRYKVSKYRDGIINMIIRNDGFCPCVSKDEPREICPCSMSKEQIEEKGHCKCNLFLKE